MFFPLGRSALFANRAEAGRRLAERLERYRDAHPVVLALPRGGVPVGYEIARALDAPLDLVLVRKIGAPSQPELALGAVANGAHSVTVLNDDVVGALGITDDYIAAQEAAKLEEIARRRALYLEGRERAPVEGRTAIVVDDGVATGATTRAALLSLRRAKPAKLVLAVPVAPADSLAVLRADVDEIECLETPSPFWAIGLHYADFEQVPDDEVVRLLKRAAEA